MATFNNEDLIKWNDLSTSLQDIIMRKITWNMLHPDLQSWLLDKERRIIELERWRRTKADPMLDDHENRISNCESQITSLWSKLGDTEDQLEDVAANAINGGSYRILVWDFFRQKQGIINPNINSYTGFVNASFMPDTGFTTGIVHLEITMRFQINFSNNVYNYVYFPIGPFGQTISNRQHSHYAYLQASVVYGNNTEFYWNQLEVPDPFHISTPPPGFPGRVFRPCFPYAYVTVRIPSSSLSVTIVGNFWYNSLDPMTFKGFDVNKLYNVGDGGYFISLPNPRDMLRSIIVS